MANGDQPKDVVTVVRMLEYTGPRAWVEATLRASHVPLRGQAKFQTGGAIRSGLVVWDQAVKEPQQ